MRKNLDCEIVRDLLPSYADGLTNETTNKTVEEHLADCTDCADTLRLMREPEEQKAPPTAEVDYLKKVRRHSSRTGIVFGIVMLAVAMILIFARLFLIGSASVATDANLAATVVDNTVYVSGNFVSSSEGLARITFEESAGIVNIRIYAAPRSFVSRNSFSEKYTVQSDSVGMVRCGDLILWENGLQISPVASQLFAAKNPFVGDMPSNTRIASILGVYEQFGTYANELQTSSEPYGWTLCLDTQVEEDEVSTARDIMTADSYVMLAAVGNLGYVTWEYQTDAGSRQYTVTTEDASAYAGRDIKECAQSASDLQALLESLSLKWAGVKEVLQEDGTFCLNITNYSKAKIYGLVMDYYLDGKQIGTCAAENADGSAMKQDDEFIFEFVPEDFPDGTTAIDLSGFSFDLSVKDEAGNTIVIREGVPVSAKYAWSWYYSLTGDFSTGFILNEG